MNRTRRKRLYALVVVAFVVGAASPALASLLSQMVHTPSGVPVRAVDGPAATIKADRVDLREFQADNHTLDVATSEGNITLSAQGHATVQVDQVNGSYTKVSNLSVSTYNLSINPDDKQRVVVGAEADSLDFTAMSVDDGAVDFKYSGSGTTTLTVPNLPADTKLAAVDQDTTEVLDLTMSDGSGTATFRLPSSSHTVVLKTDTAGKPIVNETAAEPRNGTGIAGRDVTLSVPINDSDFSRDEDNVSVDFYLDGGHVGTKHITSNQTVSMTVSNVSGGSHSWHVEVADSYQNATTSETFSFNAPMKLSIHEGANHSQLVTKDVDVEIYTTSDDSSFHQTTTVSDGTVVFGDMPAEQLKIELNATNRTSRKMIINNPYSRTDRHTVLYDTQTSETFTQCFSLDSQGAGFSPTDTWLIMQVYIQGEWRDAAGGYFQSPNKRCLAQQDSDEYRLVIEDRDGDRRGLGGFTADIGFRDQVVPLTVQGVRLSLDRGDIYRWEVAAHNSTPAGVEGAGNVTFKFRSQEATVRDLHIQIYEQGNRSNELDEMTVSGVVDSYQTSFVLTENQTQTSWVVKWNATKNGQPINGSDVVAADGGAADLGTSPLWTKVLVGAFLLVVGGVVGSLHAPIGAVVASGTAALLHTAGLYQAPETLVYFALSVAVVGFAASKAGGGA